MNLLIVLGASAGRRLFGWLLLACFVALLIRRADKWFKDTFWWM